jgi:transposase
MRSETGWLDCCPGRQGIRPLGADNRRFLEAVLWIVRAGAPWRDLHPAFGSWNSACGAPAVPSVSAAYWGEGGWGSCNAACASEHAAHVSIAWNDRKSVMNRQDCSHEAQNGDNSGRFSSVFKMCWSNPEDARLAFCCDAPYVRRVTRD